MNQNRNKDNDLQRAIDEITQKGGANGPKPAAPAAPAPQQPAGMMPPAQAPAAPQVNTMKMRRRRLQWVCQIWAG